MARSPVLLAALDFIAGVVGDNASELRKVNRRLAHLKENMMAEFANLNAALDEEAQARAEAFDRVAADVQALKDQIAELELDAADQAAVDAVTARVVASTAALRGLDPIPAPAEEPPAEEAPAEPAPADGEQPNA